ncbi:dockerin type I domain-containing protein [Paenibacillus sp. LHD-117]|uniref:dockerin type I domain-containing protein n=1 Tax=Paenibacillus sp. LHD-117 TaxID=3071412 RepID=UPI0035A87ECD
MAFLSAVSLKEGISLVDSQTDTPGVLQFIVISEGPEHAVNRNERILELSYQALSEADASSNAVTVTKATVGHADGTETDAAASSVSIEIKDVAGIPGDVNQDGKVSIGDLAIVAVHYGKDKDSADWETAQAADVDGNMMIDIRDLVLVANRIIGKDGKQIES